MLMNSHKSPERLPIVIHVETGIQEFQKAKTGWIPVFNALTTCRETIKIELKTKGFCCQRFILLNL